MPSPPSSTPTTEPTSEPTSEPAAVPGIVMLTTFELDEYVFEALRHGASGFLLKDAEPAELLDAIRVVARAVPCWRRR